MGNMQFSRSNSLKFPPDLFRYVLPAVNAKRRCERRREWGFPLDIPTNFMNLEEERGWYPFTEIRLEFTIRVVKISEITKHNHLASNTGKRERESERAISISLNKQWRVIINKWRMVSLSLSLSLSSVYRMLISMARRWTPTFREFLSIWKKLEAFSSNSETRAS